MREQCVVAGSDVFLCSLVGVLKRKSVSDSEWWVLPETKVLEL